MDDYSFGHEYRARIAELQDIAAMDRLAGQLAPASTLHRFARERDGRATSWSERMVRLLHRRSARPDRRAVAGQH